MCFKAHLRAKARDADIRDHFEAAHHISREEICSLHGEYIAVVVFYNKDDDTAAGTLDKMSIAFSVNAGA